MRTLTLCTLWIFAVSGPGCSPNTDAGSNIPIGNPLAKEPSTGEAVFIRNCEPCHRSDGQAGFYSLFLKSAVPDIAVWPHKSHRLWKKRKARFVLRESILHPLGFLPGSEVNLVRREIAGHAPNYGTPVRNCLICHRWDGKTPWPDMSPLQSPGRDFLMLPFQGLDEERLYKLFERSRSRTIFLDNRSLRHFSRKMKRRDLEKALKWLKSRG